MAGDTPVAIRAARNLLAGVERVLAVVPPGRASLHQALEAAGCEVIETDRTTRGMGASLAAAVEAAAGAEGWIVALGDMPAVKADTILALRHALESGARIVAPFDASGRRGHPVGFAAGLRQELLNLDGDVGARAILERHSDAIERVVTDDAGIFVDIDTPQDLAALRG